MRGCLSKILLLFVETFVLSYFFYSLNFMNNFEFIWKKKITKESVISFFRVVGVFVLKSLSYYLKFSNKHFAIFNTFKCFRSKIYLFKIIQSCQSGWSIGSDCNKCTTSYGSNSSYGTGTWWTQTTGTHLEEGVDWFSSFLRNRYVLPWLPVTIFTQFLQIFSKLPKL